MNTWFELALACLVCARLTRMIILDTGPWSVFKKLRERLGVENPKEFTYGGLVELFNCPCRFLLCPCSVLHHWRSGLSTLWPSVSWRERSWSPPIKNEM